MDVKFTVEELLANTHFDDDDLALLEKLHPTTDASNNRLGTMRENHEIPQNLIIAGISSRSNLSPEIRRIEEFMDIDNLFIAVFQNKHNFDDIGWDRAEDPVPVPVTEQKEFPKLFASSGDGDSTLQKQKIVNTNLDAETNSLNLCIKPKWSFLEFYDIFFNALMLNHKVRIIDRRKMIKSAIGLRFGPNYLKMPSIGQYIASFTQFIMLIERYGSKIIRFYSTLIYRLYPMCINDYTKHLARVCKEFTVHPSYLQALEKARRVHLETDPSLWGKLSTGSLLKANKLRRRRNITVNT